MGGERPAREQRRRIKVLCFFLSRKKFFFEKKAAPALREPKNFYFQYTRIVPACCISGKAGEQKFFVSFFVTA
jgi:hypothetical protein